MIMLLIALADCGPRASNTIEETGQQTSIPPTPVATPTSTFITVTPVPTVAPQLTPIPTTTDVVPEALPEANAFGINDQGQIVG